MTNAHQDVKTAEEKQDAVYIEDASNAMSPEYEAAELEPKLNWQTILAFLVCATPLQ